MQLEHAIRSVLVFVCLWTIRPGRAQNTVGLVDYMKMRLMVIC